MTEVTRKTRILLTLSLLKGIGPVGLRKVTQVPYFEEEPLAELLHHLPRNAGANIGSAAIAEAHAEAQRQIDLALAADTQIISSADPGYPALLNKTKDDPQVLFVKGKLAENPDKSVAIIGTREPTAHGKIIAERLTSFFVGEGWSIVSGLALGCDALAHEAAISARGHTVAVLAHGLHTIAPKKHKKLADEILESGGALVTEYRFGQEPAAAQFVKRDRIQAGFAQGVVTIQSDLTGGSLHASRAAIGYNRWLAIPYPTEKDIARREPKIQANLLLADGSPAEKADILRCRSSDLGRLIVLRSKSDYAHMLNLDVHSSQEYALEPAIGGLFETPTAPKASRVNDMLVNLVKKIEGQLESYQQGLVEYGQGIEESVHYVQLMKDFSALQESLRRVRELEGKIAEEQKIAQP